jgi:hypothetical protein
MESGLLPSLVGLIVISVPFLGSPANAATCDLTSPGSQCSVKIGSDLYIQADPLPAGNGVRIGSSNMTANNLNDLGTLVYDLNGNGQDNYIKLNYRRGSDSGSGDIRQSQAGQQAPVPEPTSLLLLGSGLLGWGGWQARRARRASK